ncbi:MAG: carboxymuconolactone decarboxylase family protein [Streptosporangiaceae bacterium]|nr:carboxymuconolactone decarboxylase family protein [Streptosporangiaceae bacterium]
MSAFPSHTIESAPPAARRTMAATRDHWGYLPSAVGKLATSPHTLDGFMKLNGIFESCTLDALAREVLVMTVATRNGCHVCVAIHTQRLTAMEASPSLIAALRDSAPLADPRLEAVRVFTLRVLDTTGDVGEPTPRPEAQANSAPRPEAQANSALRAFLAAGFTPQNALEVVLGIGTYTLSTLANRLVGAALDEPLAPFAWTAKGYVAPTIPT